MEGTFYRKLPLGIQMGHARVRNHHLEAVVSSLTALTTDNLRRKVKWRGQHACARANVQESTNRVGSGGGGVMGQNITV